jgi:hypothetical protein
MTFSNGRNFLDRSIKSTDTFSKETPHVQRSSPHAQSSRIQYLES